MTLLERPTEAPVRMECLHDARGVCWLCSDKDPRWREWRVPLGVGEYPPNAPRYRLTRKAEQREG
jgi:hypothetical protein